MRIRSPWIKVASVAAIGVVTELLLTAAVARAQSPGVTLGHLVLPTETYPGEKVLYGACMLKLGLGNLSFADLEQYPKTRRNLQGFALDIETIVAGHGAPVHGPELIDHYPGLLERNGS